MKLINAVCARIEELLKENLIDMSQLIEQSGIPQPTFATMKRNNTVKLSTVYGICEGLQITLKEFFNSPLFDRGNIID